MGDWGQIAPDRQTAITLMVRHANEAHRVGPPEPWLLARIDAKLTHCPYQPPTGEWVPDTPTASSPDGGQPADETGGRER